MLIVIFFATILSILSFWIIRQNSSKPSKSLMIHNVVISTEEDDRPRLLRPTGAVSRFPHGSRQVYLRFDYSKAAEGGEIEIRWFMGDQLIHSDVYVLPGPSGFKIFSLMRENGQPLPKGFYSLVILKGAERLSDFGFEIY